MAQAGYSAEILYIIALAISKASVLVLLWRITPVGVHRRIALISGSLIGMWTLASIFAAVFQCSVPDTWTILSPRCFDRVWVTNLVFCTKVLCDTTYTSTDLILDSLRHNQYTDRSYLNLYTNVYHLQLAYVKPAQSGGCLMLRHTSLVRAAFSL